MPGNTGAQTMIFGHDAAFWISAVVAAALRVLLSEYLHPFRAVVSFCTAVFAAWAATDAVLDYLQLDPTVYKYPMAAFIAVTAENMVRIWLIGTKDFSTLGHVLTGLVRIWRGGK